ncbi:hypothetical protein DL96DRAFT_316715 [Flagelloscypha sp. PMI_526]|nr:hypothetical protein DL96DRAFT_316715 [Flagelloscypha sp. PMI_526]
MFSTSHSDYRRLSEFQDDSSESEEFEYPHRRHHVRGATKLTLFPFSWRFLALCAWGINILLLSAIAMLLLNLRNTNSPFPEGQLFYSPANDALDKIPTVFQAAIPGRSETKYQARPSPELDDLWEDLYGFGISKITVEERKQMINKTEKILAGNTPEFVVQLAVFHQLHCINMLRMKLFPDYYMDKGLMDDEHLSHCIDSLRQAVSCSADVTPLVWKWNEARNAYMGRLDVVHSCRDFEKVQDWARPRAVAHLNKTFRVVPPD